MGAGQDTGALTWNVALPARRARQEAISRLKPTACVSLVQDDAEETFWVPIAVGKELDRLKRQGSLAPRSRNELVFKLRELQERQACRRATFLLDRRDYSSKELTDKLRADGYWSDVTTACLVRLRDLGLVNDARYADVFVRSKLYAGWGITKIERALTQRGVDVGELDGWPDAFVDPRGEDARAFELVARRRFGGRDPYAKAVRFLCSRGFSAAVAHSAAARLRDEGLLSL